MLRSSGRNFLGFVLSWYLTELHQFIIFPFPSSTCPFSNLFFKNLTAKLSFSQALIYWWHLLEIWPWWICRFWQRFSLQYFFRKVGCRIWFQSGFTARCLLTPKLLRFHFSNVADMIEFLLVKMMLNHKHCLFGRDVASLQRYNLPVNAFK